MKKEENIYHFYTVLNRMLFSKIGSNNSEFMLDYYFTTRK